MLRMTMAAAGGCGSGRAPSVAPIYSPLQRVASGEDEVGRLMIAGTYRYSQAEGSERDRSLAVRVKCLSNEQFISGDGRATAAASSDERADMASGLLIACVRTVSGGLYGRLDIA